LSGGLSVRAAAREAPAGNALIDEGRAMNWAELALRVDRTRNALRRRLDGVTAPVVAIAGGTGPEAVCSLLALLEAELSFVLLHPRWTRLERERALAAAGACLTIESGGALTAAPGPAASGNRGGERGAGIVFTSGTTGAPRGVVLSRAALLASAKGHAGALRWVAADRWLLSLPVAHVGGLMIVVRCLRARRALVIGGRRPTGSFDPDETLRVVESDRVTLLSVVPTMLARLVESGRRPPPSLRAVLVGGAAAPASLMERARTRGWPVLATYGLTEACSQVATERPSGLRGGAGPAVPGVEVAIGGADAGPRADAGSRRDGDAAGHAGSILIRGPVLFDGYLGDEPGALIERPFDADGWFDTGDIGSLDDRGRLRVVGRRSDRIVTGGENVDPAEVEGALLEWSGAAEACVVGLEDEEWGERVGAVLVPAAGFEALGGLAGLRRHLGGRLAGFKRPRRWRVVDGLPLAALGKVDRGACVRLLVESPGPRAGREGQ